MPEGETQRQYDNEAVKAVSSLVDFKMDTKGLPEAQEDEFTNRMSLIRGSVTLPLADDVGDDETITAASLEQMLEVALSDKDLQSGSSDDLLAQGYSEKALDLRESDLWREFLTCCAEVDNTTCGAAHMDNTAFINATSNPVPGVSALELWRKREPHLHAVIDLWIKRGFTVEDLSLIRSIAR